MIRASRELGHRETGRTWSSAQPLWLAITSTRTQDPGRVENSDLSAALESDTGADAVAGAIANETGATEGSTFLDTLAAEPALVQLVLLVFALAVFWFVLSRLARSVRDARGRAAMKDYLLGVEQALQGETKSAAKRLSRVLAEDPENTTARLFYARVLAELGDAGEAHKHHVQLLRGFGVRTKMNQIALAESLLAIDRPNEAVEPAAEAVASHPDDADAHRVWVRALLAAGRPREAGEAAEKLARLLPVGDEREFALERGARAYALAAQVSIDAGDLSTARRLLAAAGRCQLDSKDALRVSTMMEYRHGDGDSAIAALAEASVPAIAHERDTEAADGSGANAVRHAVILRSKSAVPGRSSAHGTQLTIADLVPRSAWRCDHCGAPHGASVEICEACGHVGRVVAREPDLLREIESPTHVADAIDENRAHILRLLQRLEAGGGTEAADQLVAIGAAAVEETLARAVEVGVDDAMFVPVLQRMGPSVVPDIFAAYRKRKEDWLGRFGDLVGRRSSAAVVGRVVQAFGRQALPAFEPLLDAADRDLRKVIIDFYIGLADQDEFRKVVEHFPPVEVLRQLDGAPEPVLQAFLISVEPGSFQSEVLLVEPAFTRAESVFRAAPLGQGEALEGVLRQRGFSASLCRTLIGSLADRQLGQIAQRLLDHYGHAALDAQISAFADLDQGDDVRAALRDRLSATGPAVVEPLCDCLGAAPSALDRQIIEVLRRVGDDAVPGLVEAYRQGGVLEKFAGVLIGRHNHRRRTIISALGQIESPAAETALRELRIAESDANLKLRLERALHSIAARAAITEDQARSDSDATSIQDPDSPHDHGQAG